MTKNDCKNCPHKGRTTCVVEVHINLSRCTKGVRFINGLREANKWR